MHSREVFEEHMADRVEVPFRFPIKRLNHPTVKIRALKSLTLLNRFPTGQPLQVHGCTEIGMRCVGRLFHSFDASLI
jgi:hypothetical protein